jgi:hypothetical protein
MHIGRSRTDARVGTACKGGDVQDPAAVLDAGPDVARFARRLAVEHVVRVPQLQPTRTAAWEVVAELTAEASRYQPWCRDFPDVEIVGEYRLPPAATPQRAFQTLHIDFGLPRIGAGDVPVALFTAV